MLVEVAITRRVLIEAGTKAEAIERAEIFQRFGLTTYEAREPSLETTPEELLEEPAANSASHASVRAQLEARDGLVRMQVTP